MLRLELVAARALFSNLSVRGVIGSRVQCMHTRVNGESRCHLPRLEIQDRDVRNIRRVHCLHF